MTGLIFVSLALNSTSGNSGADGKGLMTEVEICSRVALHVFFLEATKLLRLKGLNCDKN